MTSIPPSSAVPPPVLPSSGGAIPAVLTQLPSDLQSASPGTVITGTVLSADNQGQIVLQTNAGLVSLQSTVSVTVGEQVSLQLQATGTNEAQALVLSVEAAVQSDLVAAAAPNASAEAAGSATPASTIAPSVATGPIVMATVLGPSAAAAAAAAMPTSTMPAAPQAPSPTPAPASAGSAAASGPALPQPMPSAAPRAGTPSIAAAQPSAIGTAGASPAPASIGGPQAAQLPAPAAAPEASISQPPSSPSPAATAPAPSTASASTAAAPTTPAPASPSAATSPNEATSAPATTAPTARPTPSSSPPAAAPPPSAGLVAAQAGATTRPISAIIASYAASAQPSTGTDATPSPAPPSADVASLPTPPAGTQIPLRLISPLPTLASAAAGAASGQLVATVVARTPTGQVVVDTAIGRLALTAPPAADAAIGSQIAFEVAAPALRPAAAPPTISTLAAGRSLAALTTEWPALKSVLTTLAEVDPAVARQVIEAVLPRLDNPRFLGQVLSAISLPADDVKMLLGQAAVDALQHSGRSDAMAGLNADLRQLGRLNASASDWRVFYVPIFDSSEARQLRVFTRRHRAGAARRDGGGRFVVEVEFEELGLLQLDGLVQKPRLDLILRTHAELPTELQSGIADVFGQTCEAAGLAGKIFFQALPSFPVSPLDEMTKSQTDGLSI